MATLSELVSTLAQVTGLPEATVFAYGRFAREAGYIAQAGRGRGGAQMTAIDAANLIIAMCGTPVTREAGEAIRTFRALPAWRGISTQVFDPIERWVAKYERIISANNDYANFGTFMDFLISESISGDLELMLRSLPVHDVPRPPHPDFPEVWKKYIEDRTSVSFKLPESIDVIEDIEMNIKLKTNSQAASFNLGETGLIASNYKSIEFNNEDECAKYGDLSIEYCISQRTILAAGRCVADREN